MSYFRGKMRQYRVANDRFNIMLVRTLLYRPVSGTIKNMQNHPFLYLSRGPNPAATSGPTQSQFQSQSQSQSQAELQAELQAQLQLQSQLQAQLRAQSQAIIQTPPSNAVFASSTTGAVPLSTIAILYGTTWSLKGDSNILANQTLTIPAGFELQTNGFSQTNAEPFITNYSLTNNGNIINNGTITVFATQMFGKNSVVNQPGAIITNNGTINNGGTIKNSGAILGKSIKNIGGGRVIN